MDAQMPDKSVPKSSRRTLRPLDKGMWMADIGEGDGVAGMVEADNMEAPTVGGTIIVGTVAIATEEIGDEVVKGRGSCTHRLQPARLLRNRRS